MGNNNAWGQPPDLPPSPSPRHRARNIAVGALAVLVLVIIIFAASSGGQNNSPSADAGGAASSAPAVSTTTAAAAPPTSAPPPSSAPPAAQTVTYKCTGSAPDGVDITYGPEGSDYSGSSLPFSVTQPLKASADYFDVTAQLQGDGHVSCWTTVTYDSDGSSQTVTQSATASGGYNIASAEVCSGLFGDWEDC